MRVMFVLNWLGNGGAEHHTYQLANALTAEGNLCTLVSLTSTYSTSEVDQSSIRRFTGNRIYNVGTIIGVSRLIRDEKPDIILAIDERPMLFATAARRLARSSAKVVLILHNPGIKTARERLLHPVYRRFVSHLDTMIYVADSQRKQWEGHGYSPRSSVVIPNGVDLNRFTERWISEWRDRTRSNLGFASSDYVIGLCAHFRPEKNHFQLIDAIRILRDRGYPAKALLVGGGPTRESVEQYARAHGVLEHIVFTGIQDDVRPYTSAFDVGILCSIHEAAPLVSLELMAMGLPVVLSDVGNASETVRSGETGFLFQAGDTPSLVNFLQILSDPGKREAVGRAASRSVAENFGIDRMLLTYKHYLDGLAMESRRCEL